MIVAIALLTYGFLAGTFGAYLLRRSTWPARAPRMGVMAWQALTGSVVASAILAGLALAIPISFLTPDLAGLLDTCVLLLRAQYSTPGGAITGTVGLLLALGVIARTMHCLIRSGLSARTGRIRQRTQLALVAHPDHDLHVDVLEHSSCAAYCVPGRGGRIVVTSAALKVLDTEEMAAVVEHERAHLRGRHHLVVQTAGSLRAAFPFVPAFRYAQAEVARLTEMVADDAAARKVDRLALATALVRLAEGSAPVGALGAGGSTALIRVRRLAEPASPLGPVRRFGTLAGLALLVLAPVVLAAAPAFAVVSANYCPVSLAL